MTTDVEPMPPRWWPLLPVGLLLLPILVAWVQFECHVEQVWMFPLLTVLGGLAVGAMLGKRVRWMGSKLGALLLGLPLGIAGVWVPAKHFHAHLSSVRILSWEDDVGRREGEPRPGFFRVFSYSLPPMPELEIEPYTPYPDFEVETIEVGDKLASGEWELRDGRYYARQPDGTMAPVEMSTAEERMAEMSRDDQGVEDRIRKAREQRFERYHEELRKLRQSGRIFSSPD